jgi:hypothetical protein
VAPFHFYHGVNELFLRSLRTRALPALGRKQHAVLSFPQQAVKMKQTGRLRNDGGTENACGAHEKSAQVSDDPIRDTQVGRRISVTIEDQQLMPDQRRFGDNGTESAWTCQSGHGDNHMNEKDEEVVHRGNRISP